MSVRYHLIGLCIIIFQAISIPVSSQEINYGFNDGEYIEVLGRNIYYEEYGQGMPVLMLHGGPGSIMHFSKLIPELSKSYRVIAIDAPGQGRSERPERLSYELLAANASAFLDEMGIDQCYVVGWSDGAATSILLAAKRPGVVKKVFASGAFANLDGFTPEEKEFWTTVTPEIVEKSWGGYHLEYQKMYPDVDWNTLIYDIRRMVNDRDFISEEQLKSITSEVLLVYGDHDMFTFEHIGYMHQTIPGSELMILPGTSHSTFAEQPEMMAMTALDFFAK